MSTAQMSWWSSSVSANRTAEAVGDTDAGLLSQLSSGSRDALARVYSAHASPVFRFAWHLTASREAAEEITQEVFLVLMRDPARYDASRAPLRSWLFGIARHLARKHWRQPDPDPLDHESDPAAEIVADESSVLERIIQREDWGRVQQAVASLPEAFREALVLYHLHGLSYEEASQVMECPVGTVRSRIARAREMLARRLKIRMSPAAAGAVTLGADESAAGSQFSREGGSFDVSE